MLNYKNEDITVTEKETEIFIKHICGMFPNLKLLGKVRAREPSKDYFSILPIREDRSWHDDEYEAYSLTYLGFVNAVVWTKKFGDRGDRTIYYFYTPNNDCKEIGDTHFIKSVNMKSLLRKITKNNLQPDSNILSWNGTNRSNVIKNIYEELFNNNTFQREYQNISVNGNDYHMLLNKLFEEIPLGSNILDNAIKARERFEELTKKIAEQKINMHKTFGKPVTFLINNDYLDKNECIVCTGKFKYVSSQQDYDNFKSKYDENVSNGTLLEYDLGYQSKNYIVLYDIKFESSNDISNFEDNTKDDIANRLSMYRMTLQNKNPQAEFTFRGLAKKIGQYDSDSSTYDEDLKIFYHPMWDENKDCRAICVLES